MYFHRLKRHVRVWCRRKLSDITLMVIFMTALFYIMTRLSNSNGQPAPSINWLKNTSQQARLNEIEDTFLDRKRLLLDKISNLEHRLKHLNGSDGSGTATARHLGLRRVSAKMLTSAISYNNEYEVVPFEFYNGTHVFGTYLGMGGERVAKPAGRKRKAFDEVLALLRRDKGLDLVGALYRTVPTLGDAYELPSAGSAVVDRPNGSEEDSRRADNSSRVHLAVSAHTNNTHRTRLTVVRPFGPLIYLEETTLTESTPINIVLFLKGTEASRLRFFLDRLREITKTHSKLSLTVVFESRDVSNLDSILRGESLPIEVLRADETTNQVETLRKAFRDREDDFLCMIADLDLVILKSALTRCSYHTDPGRAVYYPFVFSLYDPEFIYQVVHRERIPKLKNQLRIDDSKGNWHHWQHTVSCQYRSDFIRISDDLGSDTWQGAASQLYSRYLNSTYKVYRAPDPGLFLLYRPRCCTPFPDKMFWNCIRDKIYRTGSHVHMTDLIKEKRHACKSLV